MKIAFVVDDTLDKTDGVQQYVLVLGRWFVGQGHVVHYLVGESKRTDIVNIHSLSRNVSVKFNQNRLSTPLPANKKRISRLHRAESFDVLHVQIPYSPMMAARIIDASPDHAAIFGTFHIMPATKMELIASRGLKTLIGRSLKRLDQVFSVSPPAQAFAQKSFGIRSKVLPNVIEQAAFEAGKPLKKYMDGKVNIVFLGRLVERKGCLYLLRAVNELQKRGYAQDLRLIICGKGPLEKTLREFVNSHKLNGIVEFAGFIGESEKPDYFASAHIAVFPSTGGESFGIVLLEAMAAGTEVVIGGDNPGYRSVLQGRNKQLINPKDINAFSDTLARYIANEPDRQECKAWQRAYVQQFDVSKVGQVLLDYYQEMIAKRRKSRDTGNNT